MDNNNTYLRNILCMAYGAAGRIAMVESRLGQLLVGYLRGIRCGNRYPSSSKSYGAILLVLEDGQQVEINMLDIHCILDVTSKDLLKRFAENGVIRIQR